MQEFVREIYPYLHTHIKVSIVLANFVLIMIILLKILT